MMIFPFRSLLRIFTSRKLEKINAVLFQEEIHRNNNKNNILLKNRLLKNNNKKFTKKVSLK